MAISLVGTPDIQFQDAANNTSLVSAALAVNAGDILVIKLYLGSASQTSACTVDGNATALAANGVTAGYTPTKIHTYVAVGPTATVTSTYAGSGNWHVMVTEVWRDAQLAATPATNATVSWVAATGGFSATLTTVAANSVVSWVAGDFNGIAYGTIAYRSSATTDGATSNRVGGAGGGSMYFAYQNAVTAGAQTFGTTTPTGSAKFQAVGIEIQAAAVAAIPPILVMATRR